MTFHFYKGGIKNKYPSKKMTLEDLADLIRSDVYRQSVEIIRESSKKDQQNILKEKLDYVTVSGLFTHRHKQRLTSHSGLIVLDIDEKEDLEATFLQLTTDPYIRLMFISPRGNGIKAVVAIDPEKHDSSYLELCLYMKLTYGIELDVSGSDVSRACYLSWHPDLYFNPESEVYTLKGLIPPKEYVKKSYDDGQSRVDAKTIQHVTAVVERIEAAGLNICGQPGDGGDYRTRLLLRFSLCTLGEAGRDLTHRVFKFYDKYDPHEIDDKYSENIRNTRFTHPAFFFRTCKDLGIDVSKPGKKAKPAPAETSGQPGKPVAAKPEKDAKQTDEKKSKKKRDDSEDDDDYEPFTVWYRENGSTWVKASKNWEVVADDFQIFVKYMTEDESENKSWILELRHRMREVEYVEVPHEDFCSAKKLSNILAGKRLSFKISDSHLKELHSHLFRKTEFSTAVKIVRFGYHPPSGVFIFANKAVNGQVMVPDEFGIIQTKNRAGHPIHLSMPVTNKNKVHRFTLTDHLVSFNDFFRKYSQAHGYENAFVPACFFLMSLFRDVALTHKNFSPILYLKGGAGTGKSSMARVLTAGFGKKQEGVNLKSKNTDAALIKIMSQASNCICWFDEYHNEFPHEGLLQAAYDNDGYHRSKDNTGIETDAVEIHSALALTSNYLPDNPIFFSRCVFIPITSQEKSDVQRAAFYDLEEWQEAGLGCMTVELLQYRAMIEKQFAFYYDLLYKRLKKDFTGEKVPERLFANMAQVMAAGLVLSCERKISMTEFEDIEDITEEFIRVGSLNIRRQHRIMSEKTPLSEFFEIIQQLYDQFQVHQEIHFDFEKIGKEHRIKLWFPQLYNLYAQQYRRTFNKAPADKDTLQTELAAFEELPDWESLKKQLRFRNDGEGKMTSSTVPRPGSCSVSYDRLKEKFGVEFELRKSKKDG